MATKNVPPVNVDIASAASPSFITRLSPLLTSLGERDSEGLKFINDIGFTLNKLINKIYTSKRGKPPFKIIEELKKRKNIGRSDFRFRRIYQNENLRETCFN